MLAAILVILCVQFFFSIFLMLAIFSAISNGNAATEEFRTASMALEKEKVELLTKMFVNFEWERILKNGK